MNSECKEVTIKASANDKVNPLLARINFNSGIKDISGSDNVDRVEGNIFLVKNNIGLDGLFEKGTISLVKDSFLFSTARDFSLSFWIKSGPQRDAVIISNKDWVSGSNIGWLLGINNDYLVCNWKGNASSRLDIGAEQNIKIADNQWHHIAVTFDRQGDVFFIRMGVRYIILASLTPAV